MNERQKIWRIIINQWRDKFPFLKIYGGSRLFYRTDILLIGIWLEKDKYGCGYSPSFVLKPLWGDVSDNYDRCLHTPLYTNEQRRYWYDIDIEPDFKHHDFYFKRYTQSANPLYDKVLKGVISYDWIYNEAVFDCEMHNKHHGWFFYDNWMFLELMFALSLYFEDSILQVKTTKALDRFIKQSEKRLVKGERGLGPGSVEWFEKYKDRINSIFSSRESFLSICEENSKSKKIRILNKGTLVSTYPEIKDGFENRMTNLYNRLFHPNLFRW